MTNSIPNIDNGLSPEINRLLITWKENIDKTAIVHKRKALKYNVVNNVISITVAIFSVLSASGGLASITQCSTTDYFGLCIFQIIISLLASLLASIITVLNLTSKTSDNKNAHDRYKSLSRNIDSILTIKNNPEEAPNILNGIRSVFDDILNSSPLISDKDAPSSLQYAIFDRETRKNSLTVGVIPPEKLSVSTEIQPPATKEELDQINKNSKVICIDINLEEKKKEFKMDPMLKYQLERFNSNNDNKV